MSEPSILHPVSASSDVDSPFSAFARLLRLRRESAGLSRRRLARLAQLSEATIKLLEAAKTRPTRATLLRLLLVEALRLSPADLPLSHLDLTQSLLHLAQPVPTHSGYLIAHFDPLPLVEDLDRTLAGAGGHIEQSQLYLSSHSALGYLRYLDRSPDERRRRQSLPIASLAEAIVAHQRDRDLTLVALGPGDGRLEVRLTEHLHMLRVQRLDLWLLDISSSLLQHAYRQAHDRLGGLTNTTLMAISGSFHELPTYTELFTNLSPVGKQRVFVLLGTLTNLDSEARFLKDTLGSVARVGDLLLLDAPIAMQPPVNVPEPKSASYHASLSLLTQWLCEPLYRQLGRSPQCQTRITLAREPDDCGQVPGSVASSLVATIESRNPQTVTSVRRFSMLRQRQFPLPALRELLCRSGWPPLRILPAHDPSQGQVALLCQRRS